MSKKPPAARLRRARMADVGALAALEKEFFTSDHQISDRGFRHYVTSPKSDLIVADVDGAVAGCVLVNYRRDSSLARLYTIAVASAFQRRGIARQLMAAAEGAARRRGCRVMRLEVRADDAGAIALYESSGYILFGRRERYYDNRIDALRFDKSLGRALGRRAVGMQGPPRRNARLRRANRF